MSNDAINHPPHYNAYAIEPIEVIEDWALGFELGSVFKYIARAPLKGNAAQDLGKAKWYMLRACARVTTGDAASLWVPKRNTIEYDVGFIADMFCKKHHNPMLAERALMHLGIATRQHILNGPYERLYESLVMCLEVTERLAQGA